VATVYSLAFSPDSMYLVASSNTETIHIFRLVNQEEKPPEVASSWMNSFSRMFGGVAYYLPKRTAEVLTQDRAFASVHSQSARTKTTVAMNIFNKTLKLFVAGYDGVLSVYEVNTNEGGECKQISQHLLFNMTQNLSNMQTITTNDRQNSLGGSKQLYPKNTIRNENHSISVSSKLTNEKPSNDQPFSTAVDDKDFPKLPLPPKYDDE
ncbi:unnamed protein product, partial [Rotaria socialis]